MDVYDALVRAYNEESGCSSPEGEADDLLSEIANFVGLDALSRSTLVTEFEFLAATLARAARYVGSAR